jgi:2-amino-4-hydroxy-6-hydroxymethyldihydropteridine diphosphokinase
VKRAARDGAPRRTRRRRRAFRPQSAPPWTRIESSRALLGLGSNLGDRRGVLRQAISEIEALALLTGVSPLYETEPVGYLDQPDFYNAVISIDWPQRPEALLAAAQEIERKLGRRLSVRNGPRAIDIDLLDIGGIRLDRPGLRLPHPRISERRFVLEPLAALAPKWAHPVVGKTAAELRDALPEVPRVRCIEGPSWATAPTS